MSHTGRWARWMSRWSTRDLGRRGERAAERYLKKSGLKTLGRNLQTHAGEADLLMVDPHTNGIVLVEVKSRRRVTSERGRDEPERQITPDKRRRLRGIAQFLRRTNRWESRPIRIDVVAVDFIPGQRQPVIRHHKNAVQ